MADGRWTMEICCRALYASMKWLTRLIGDSLCESLHSRKRLRAGCQRILNLGAKIPESPKLPTEAADGIRRQHAFFLLFLALFDRVSNICWSGGEKIKEAGRAGCARLDMYTRSSGHSHLADERRRIWPTSGCVARSEVEGASGRGHGPRRTQNYSIKAPSYVTINQHLQIQFTERICQIGLRVFFLVFDTYT